MVWTPASHAEGTPALHCMNTCFARRGNVNTSLGRRCCQENTPNNHFHNSSPIMRWKFLQQLSAPLQDSYPVKLTEQQVESAGRSDSCFWMQMHQAKDARAEYEWSVAFCSRSAHVTRHQNPVQADLPDPAFAFLHVWGVSTLVWFCRRLWD